MTTDFTYGNKTITTSGPTKPATINSPGDVRTRIQTYADISTIPMPYIGMPIVVLEDETNENKMTEYRVKSLKANTLGVQDTVVNEVVRLKDFLEISNSGNVSQEDIEAAVNNYFVENPVQSGATAEQIAQIQTNTDDITNLKSKISDIPIKITKSEYNALPENEKTGKVFMIIDEPEEEYSLSYSNNTLKLLKGSKIISTVTITSSTQTPTETYGEIILSKESSTIIKGNKDTFTVCLDKAPTNEQIISLTSNSMDVTLSTETLTFTSDNYNVPQSVEITVASSTTLTNASISLTSSNVASKSMVITISNSGSSSGSGSGEATLMHSYSLFSKDASEDGTYRDLTGSWNLNSKQADRDETTLIDRLGSFSIKMYDFTYVSQYEQLLLHTGQVNGVNITSKTPLNGRILITRGISHGSATGSISLKYYDIDSGSLNDNVATSGNIPLNSNPIIILTSDAENKVTKLYIDGTLVYTLNQQTALCGLTFDNGVGGKAEIYSGVLKVGE